MSQEDARVRNPSHRLTRLTAGFATAALMLAISPLSIAAPASAASTSGLCLADETEVSWAFVARSGEKGEGIIPTRPETPTEPQLVHRTRTGPSKAHNALIAVSIIVGGAMVVGVLANGMSGNSNEKN